MKSWCKNLLAIGLGVSLISACSSNDVEEEIVSELTEINQTVFPSIDWTASVGNGVSDYYSQLRPSVNYNKVFVADRDGMVSAFDQATGDLIWEVDFSEQFAELLTTKTNGVRLASGITAARNKVFVGGETGILVALEEATGAVVWSVKTNGELLSIPTVADDVVAVHTSKGSFETYNIDTGEKLWTHEMQLPKLTLRGTSSASYEAGGFFIGTADGKVAVVVKNNGQVAWEQTIYNPTGGNEFARMADVDMTPLILGDNLYAVSYNGNLVSMEVRTGRIAWTRKYSSYNELAEAGLSLYLVDDRSRIYAVDRRNGLELWSNSVLKNRQLTSPAVVGNYVVVGDFEGYLHFINRDTGEIAARIEIDDDGLFGQPLVIEDKIYVQGRSGEVAVISLTGNTEDSTVEAE